MCPQSPVRSVSTSSFKAPVYSAVNNGPSTVTVGTGERITLNSRKKNPAGQYIIL